MLMHSINSVVQLGNIAVVDMHCASKQTPTALCKEHVDTRSRR